MAITLDVAQRLQGIEPSLPPPPVSEQKEEIPKKPAADSAYMEESIKKVEEHYKKKIAALQEKSEQLTRTRLEHLQEAITDAEAKFTNQSKTPVCLERQLEVFECYRNNPKNTLHCGKEAQAFNACVAETQRQVFAQSQLYGTS